MESCARGVESPLLDDPIDAALRRTAGALGDRTALVVRHQRARLTWSDLDRKVETVARALAGLGLRPGDRAGVWSANCVEWILLQLGCARSAIVLINVNPAYRSHELSYVLRQSGMKALFLWKEDARAHYGRILEEASAGGGYSLRHVVFLGGGEWADFLAGGANYEAAPSPTDVCNIQYTSGTTGSPKGVLLTHRNLINNAALVGAQMKITPGDTLCSPVPLYHCFGCVMSSLMSLVTGCTLVLPNWQFDARATLEAVDQERCTALYGVPTMFIAALDHPDFARFDLSSLRTGIMAGAPCPIEVMRRVVGAMHCRDITIAYGQTESSPVITMSSVDDDLELRVSTVGRALANTEVRIVSPVTGETMPTGEQGELCTRGYLVMKGYDGDEDATQKAIDKDGWLHTGDLAVMRPDGCFRITGRAKDMIIRGGENIYPREVEEFLYTHPAIADVQVVGLPDARLGETVCAWIRLKPGATLNESEVREYCRGRIAHFKVPQYVRFVEAFPMTVTGKIQKFRIREQEIQDLGLEKAARIETA